MMRNDDGLDKRNKRRRWVVPAWCQESHANQNAAQQDLLGLAVVLKNGLQLGHGLGGLGGEGTTRWCQEATAALYYCGSDDVAGGGSEGHHHHHHRHG